MRKMNNNDYWNCVDKENQLDELVNFATLMADDPQKSELVDALIKARTEMIRLRRDVAHNIIENMGI